jgi:hypothetical protein
MVIDDQPNVEQQWNPFDSLVVFCCSPVIVFERSFTVPRSEIYFLQKHIKVTEDFQMEEY